MPKFPTVLLAAACSVVMLACPAIAQYSVETRVEGLEYPWSVAFLPDGLEAEPVAGVPEVLHSGQGGLLDVALHPDFGTNRLVYLTWTAGTPRDNTLHLGRGRLEAGALEDFQILFSAEPRRSTDVHYGGRIAFLPEDTAAAGTAMAGFMPATIVLGIGDGFDFREQAQRPQTHFGSFVRLNLDGQPMPAAFPGSAPGVFTIGHRNPQAVVFDAETGTLYAHEHGPQGGDEINVLEAGGNYGWPIASYGIDYTGALVTPFQTYPGMTDPIRHWVPSIAPAGMAIYRGDMFPEWQGDLFVAALIPGDADVPSGHVRRVDLEDGEVVGEEVLFGDLDARIRDVRTGPDGALWLLTDEAEGRLVRVGRE